jgi:hypothetical protein
MSLTPQLHSRIHIRRLNRSAVRADSCLSVQFVSLVAFARTELYRGKWLLIFAKFLESRIGAQGIPERIKTKKGRRNGALDVPAGLESLL